MFVLGVQSEKEAQIRSLIEKSAKLESELRSTENVRQDLVQARADCQKLHLHSQDLTQQVRTTTQELQRARTDVQQIPILRGEMDNIRAELQRARCLPGHLDFLCYCYLYLWIRDTGVFGPIFIKVIVDLFDICEVR